MLDGCLRSYCTREYAGTGGRSIPNYSIYGTFRLGASYRAYQTALSLESYYSPLIIRSYKVKCVMHVIKGATFTNCIGPDITAGQDRVRSYKKEINNN